MSAPQNTTALDAKFAQLEQQVCKMARTLERANAANAVLMQTLLNQIEQKLDVLANGEVGGRPKATPKTKNQLLKNKLKENIDSYLGVLYTQEDLDRLYLHEEVASRSEAHKVGRLADILYKEIQSTPELKAKLDAIHDEYKATFNQGEA